MVVFIVLFLSCLMIPLLANTLLSPSCLLQRSYTLIVEALDFSNETSGEYLSLSGISILPSSSLFCPPPSLPASVSQGNVWEESC